MKRLLPHTAPGKDRVSHSQRIIFGNLPNLYEHLHPQNQGRHRPVRSEVKIDCIPARRFAGPATTAPVALQTRLGNILHLRETSPKRKRKLEEPTGAANQCLLPVRWRRGPGLAYW